MNISFALPALTDGPMETPKKAAFPDQRDVPKAACLMQQILACAALGWQRANVRYSPIHWVRR
jgi:hypothetical protein